MAATYRFRAPGEGFNAPKVPGGYLDVIVEIVADASYAAGGYAFGLAQLQGITPANMIESVEVVNHWGTDAGTSAYLARYDKTNAKVQAFGMNAAAGAGNAFTETPNNQASLSTLFCALRVRYH